MQTQLMPEPISTPAAAEAWLERAGSDAPLPGLPERVPLAKLPLVIGRIAPADVRIDSTRVSREHAVIDRVDGRYVVFDKGSTNGTFVNGQRIAEQELDDGDTLAIADVEFTFCLPAAAPRGDGATQVYAAQATRPDGAGHLVRAVRRLHEELTQRSLPRDFAPLVCLADEQTVAFEAVAWHESGLSGQRGLPDPLASAECRLTRRWHQLQRLLAVEQAAALPDGVSVLLGVSPYELGSSELADELLLLPPLVGGGQRLLVAIPDAAVSDAPAFHELCGRLRRGGFGIVHAVFAAGGAQLRQRRELAPDYVKLVGTLSRDLHASAPRRRQVRDVVEAAGEIGAAVIASDVRRAEEAAACRELGCTWAQGPWAQAAWQSTAALGERPPRA